MTQDQQPALVERLLREEFRLPLEASVSAHLGRAWHAQAIHDKSERASHPAATLTDGRYMVFVKLGEGPLAADQIEQEVAGLRLLTARSGVGTPVVIATLQVAATAVMVMEAVDEIVERELTHWQQIGQTLARVHAVKGDRFGLETHCYWGSLYQDNTPLEDWPTFFWERRIEPRLSAALNSGNLPHELVPQIEQLRPHLPALCGPPVAPTLLHGDAHQNNFLSTSKGALLIDPSIYYGHPEIDLAHIDFFESVPHDFFQGYATVTPIDPGFPQRRDLWRIPTWLAMVEVDGPQHLPMLRTSLQQYV